MQKDFIFTSESVSEGHPDKMADQVSDAVLDAILTQDKHARVACETLLTTGLCVIAGEITTSAVIDYNQIARQTIKRIGYDSSEIGFDYNTCSVLVTVGKQSPDIAQGVNEGEDMFLDQGAGDQGLMFGYACNETPVLMPMPIYLAHRLTQRQSELRKDGRLPWLRPDAKSQVSIRYVDGKPQSIDTVVLSTQHHPEVSHAVLTEAVIEEIIKPVMPKNMLTADTRYLVNPTGRFVIGGPMGDAGLTGRKIIVDTYGGAAPHGGGAFSGKDPSKVDRSRRLRRPLRGEEHRRRRPGRQVHGADQLRHRCRQAHLDDGRHLRHRQNPRSENRRTDRRAFRPAPQRHRQHARPAAPDLHETASYGHFGREEPDFTWEVTDKAAALKAAAGL